jgi:hypothetical protein
MLCVIARIYVPFFVVEDRGHICALLVYEPKTTPKMRWHANVSPIYFIYSSAQMCHHSDEDTKRVIVVEDKITC